MAQAQAEAHKFPKGMSHPDTHPETERERIMASRSIVILIV